MAITIRGVKMLFKQLARRLGGLRRESGSIGNPNLFEALQDTGFQVYVRRPSSSTSTSVLSPYETQVFDKLKYLKRSNFISLALKEFEPYLKNQPAPKIWMPPSQLRPRVVREKSEATTITFSLNNYIYPAQWAINEALPNLRSGIIQATASGSVSRLPTNPDCIFLSHHLEDDTEGPIVATGEFKRPLIMDNAINEGFEAYIEAGEFNYTRSKIQDSKSLRILDQIWSQMNYNEVKYGFLCDAERVWFFRRKGEILEVSKQFRASHDPLVLIFTVFMLLGLRQTPNIKVEKLKAFGITNEPASSETTSKDSPTSSSSPLDQSYFRQAIERFLPVQNILFRVGKRIYSHQPLRVERKYPHPWLTTLLNKLFRNEQPLILVDEIGHGAISNAFRGQLLGKSVVAKIAADLESREALAREGEFYEKFLKKWQGTFVPQSHGLFEGEGFSMLLLEDCGQPVNVSKLEDLPLDDQEALAKHLQELHAAGIHHRDLSPSNVVRSPTTGKLRLIDFHMAIKPKSECSVHCGDCNLVRKLGHH